MHCLTVVYCLIFGLFLCGRAEIVNFKNYDNVFYDSHLINKRHVRVSRSLDSHLNIKFNSLNKVFDLKLKPMKSIFKDDQFEINDQPLAINNNIFYDGRLTDDPDSYVSGSIIDGVFYGIIKTKNGTYHVESSRKYIKNDDETVESESIIYHEDDVILNNNGNNERNVRSVVNERAGCASEDTYKVLEEIQKEAYETNVRTKSTLTKSDASSNQNSNSNNNKKRIKRQSFPSDKNVCSMYLKVDPFYYKEIYNKEGNKNSQKTSSFILSYLQSYVSNLNSIYGALKFYNNSDKSVYYEGLKFVVYRTKIITDTMCNSGNLKDADNKLCTQNLDVGTFLSYASYDDFSAYCLGFVFSARDFSDGTLGLAWIAKPSGSIGGVCETYQTVQGVNRSLNSGILTIMNYKVRVAEAVTYVTFAHEVGHAFGSEHDPSNATCMPGDSNGGNYIMYSQATSGKKQNNKLFSQCSINYMSAVVSSLIAKGTLCFTAPQTAICGNMVVEDGEQCDCGYSSDCTESCCYHAEYEAGLRCKLKPETSCSPSQGPCCNSACQFSAETEICFNKTECLYDVKCSGTSALCPKDDPIYFNDYDLLGVVRDCNDGTQVCRNGTCTGSICEKYNLVQCYLEGNLQNKSTNRTAMCHLFCEGASTNNICTDSFVIPLFNNKTNSNGFILKPGSLCAGTLGYCDIFSRCRSANEEGPLSKLEKLLVNSDLLDEFKSWITTYWWAILIAFIGVLVLTGIITYLCSLCVTTSNPKKSKSHKKV